MNGSIDEVALHHCSVPTDNNYCYKRRPPYLYHALKLFYIKFKSPLMSATTVEPTGTTGKPPPHLICARQLQVCNRFTLTILLTGIAN